MSFSDPFISRPQDHGKPVPGGHVASKGASAGKTQRVSEHAIRGAQASGSDAQKHPSANGFAPAGRLNKGAPEREGKTPIDGTSPFQKNRPNAPSGSTREGGIPVPLD